MLDTDIKEARILNMDRQDIEDFLFSLFILSILLIHVNTKEVVEHG